MALYLLWQELTKLARACYSKGSDSVKEFGDFGILLTLIGIIGTLVFGCLTVEFVKPLFLILAIIAICVLSIGLVEMVDNL